MTTQPVPQFAGQPHRIRGSIARMTSRAAAIATLTTLAVLGVPAVASAHQPPPAKCKVISQAQHLERVGSKNMLVTVTVTTSKCRGQIVTTTTWARLLDGPR